MLLLLSYKKEQLFCIKIILQDKTQTSLQIKVISGWLQLIILLESIMVKYWNKIVHPHSGTILHLQSEDGRVLLREYVKYALMHQRGGATDLYTISDEDNAFIFSRKKDKSSFRVKDLKPASAGLSGDKVFICKMVTKSSQKEAILKVFQKRQDFKDELAAIRVAKEKKLAKHFPEVYSSGKLTTAHDTFNFPQRQRYFIVSNKINGISIQSLLTQICESDEFPEFKELKGSTTEPAVFFKWTHVREIVLQLFYILYQLKLNGQPYNHCDFHADNIFISFTSNVNFQEQSLIKIKLYANREFKIPSSQYVLKVIDLDTMTKVRRTIFGKTTICTKSDIFNTKSSFSGRAKIVKKSLELLTACNSLLEDADFIAQRYTHVAMVDGHPVLRMAEAASNPSDGDMWHFFFIVVLFSQYYNKKLNRNVSTTYKHLLTLIKKFAPKQLRSGELENIYTFNFFYLLNILEKLFPNRSEGTQVAYLNNTEWAIGSINGVNIDDTFNITTTTNNEQIVQNIPLSNIIGEGSRVFYFDEHLKYGTITQVEITVEGRGIIHIMEKSAFFQSKVPLSMVTKTVNEEIVNYTQEDELKGTTVTIKTVNINEKKVTIQREDTKETIKDVPFSRLKKVIEV